MDLALRDVLSKLRDIHPAPTASFWPPAPGWIILILLILFTGMLFYAGYRYRTRTRRYVLTQLEILRVQPFSSEVISQLSILMRRIALHLFPRHQVAGVHGEAWLVFLNKTGKTEEFSSPVGRSLISVPYRGKVDKSYAPALFALVEAWVRNNL